MICVEYSSFVLRGVLIFDIGLNKFNNLYVMQLQLLSLGEMICIFYFNRFDVVRVLGKFDFFDRILSKFKRKGYR